MKIFLSNTLVLLILLISGCVSKQKNQNSLSYEVKTLGEINCKNEDAEKTLEEWKPFLSQSLLKNKTVKDRWFKKANKIFLRGPIEFGDFEHFNTLANSLGDKLEAVNVISSGGETGAGSAIGEYIFNKNIPVEVAGPCLSSCANYLFGFAKRRVLLPKAFIGFHGNHTALVNKDGGLETFIEKLKPVMREFYKNQNKDPKELELEVERNLAITKKNTIEVMDREKEIYAFFGVTQSFFDKTQTIRKGYKKKSEGINFNFIYPEKKVLNTLGFNIASGGPNNCYAYHLYRKAVEKPVSVIIAE